MDLRNSIFQFMQGAKAQYGENMDPRSISNQILGGNFANPKEALDAMLANGRISQQNYEGLLRLMTFGGNNGSV